jgi:hypothetical protein
MKLSGLDTSINSTLVLVAGSDRESSVGSWSVRGRADVKGERGVLVRTGHARATGSPAVEVVTGLIASSIQGTFGMAGRSGHDTRSTQNG